MKLQDRLGISDEMIEAIRSVTEKKAADPVSSDELKGKYKEREDKDIDNDGDTDKSDKFLHKKRKAISKNIKKSKADEIDVEPDLDDNIREAAAHADHVSLHPHPTKKNSYHVGEVGKNLKGRLKTGETVSDSEVDDLADMGYRIKTHSKGLKEATGVAAGALDPHNCATHVYHEQWGDGQTIFSMHAEPNSEGLVEWYDVMFEHGIEKQVYAADMDVLAEMSHGNHKKKKMKKEDAELKEGGAVITYKDDKGKEHKTTVFTARDAQAEMEHLRKKGYHVVNKSMA